MRLKISEQYEHNYQTGRNYSTTVGELEAKEKAQSIIPEAVKT